jgi:hypothetical protein
MYYQHRCRKSTCTILERSRIQVINKKPARQAGFGFRAVR